MFILGIDKERVFNGRTGVEVYFDFMRSFKTELDDLFTEGSFSAVEIGFRSSGELRYPSFSKRMGWRYLGIGDLIMLVNIILGHMKSTSFVNEARGYESDEAFTDPEGLSWQVLNSSWDRGLDVAAISFSSRSNMFPRFGLFHQVHAWRGPTCTPFGLPNS